MVLSDGSTVTMPANVELVVTSSFRNPERQERLGSVTASAHLKGRAVDFSLTGFNDDEEKELSYYIMWEIFTAHPPASADRFALESGPNRNIRVANIGSEGLTDTDGADWDSAGDELAPVNNGIADIFGDSDHLHFQDNQ
jgi:hypothetical protein